MYCGKLRLTISFCFISVGWQIKKLYQLKESWILSISIVLYISMNHSDLLRTVTTRLNTIIIMKQCYKYKNKSKVFAAIITFIGFNWQTKQVGRSQNCLSWLIVQLKSFIYNNFSLGWARDDGYWVMMRDNDLLAVSYYDDVLAIVLHKLFLSCFKLFITWMLY